MSFGFSLSLTTTPPVEKTTSQDEYRWVAAEDCRTFMATLKDNSVSLIVTDPPYFIDGMDDKWNRETLERRTRSAGVVKSLPIGMKFDRRQGLRLHKFMQPIAEQWLRIIRPGGFALCFSQNRLTHHAAMAIEEAGFEIRDILAWQYEGQAKAFSQDHFIHKRNIPQVEKNRLIAKLEGRKTPQLKPQFESIIMAQAPRDGTFVDNWDRWETGLIDPRCPVIDPARFPGTIIPAKKPRERHGHMTTKPVDLLQHLIRIFCPEGALVFDPFLGSGSTGVAARMEGRAFIGAEIDKDMARTAERRIQNAV